MNFPPLTKVQINKAPFQIQQSDNLLFLGSCFSDNIGGYLQESATRVMLNPFGVLYNPHSISQSIQRLVDSTSYSISDLSINKDLFFHYDFSSHVSHTDPEQALEMMNLQVLAGHDYIKKTRLLILTLGTSRVFQHTEKLQIVANCHKMPADLFTRKLMSAEENTKVLEDAFLAARQLNPDIKILLTVSPIRHWKDGATSNQLSKSILIQTVHDLITRYPRHIFYFPAYEIMMDELRDYRYYADDMLHPSRLAIEYIRNQFKKVWLTKELQAQIKDVQKWLSMKSHRVRQSNSIENKQFQEHLIEQKIKIENQYGLILK